MIDDGWCREGNKVISEVAWGHIFKIKLKNFGKSVALTEKATKQLDENTDDNIEH